MSVCRALTSDMPGVSLLESYTRDEFMRFLRSNTCISESDQAIGSKIVVHRETFREYKIGLMLGIDAFLLSRMCCYGFDFSKKDIIGSIDYDKTGEDQGAVPAEIIYNTAIGGLIRVDLSSTEYQNLVYRLARARNNEGAIPITALVASGINAERNFAHYITMDILVTREFLNGEN